MSDRRLARMAISCLFMRLPFKLLQETDLDVVGFGTNAIDYLIRVPSYPEYAKKIELTDWKLAAGGEIATTMTGLSRLGMRTAYCGRVGDDDEGALGIRSLKDDGVNVEMIEVASNARTQVGFIIIDERSGERTVLWKRDQRLAYQPDEAPLDALASTKMLHLTPHDAAACTVMAREARKRGVLVSADIDNIFDGIDELLPLVDVMISSIDIPERLTGISDLNTALSVLSDKYNFALTGATRGEEGSILVCEGEVIETDGFAVPGGCKDTTGAGDAFRVGLLYGILIGAEISMAAIFGNAVAALKCRQLGARTALPNIDELTELTGNRNSL